MQVPIRKLKAFEKHYFLINDYMFYDPEIETNPHKLTHRKRVYSNYLKTKKDKEKQKIITE